MAKDFDPVKAVADFRKVMTKLDSELAPSPAARKRLELQAKRLRNEWKKWNGDDELFEMAFGEPFDEQGKPA